MRKISAHYIFDGTNFHKYATLLLDNQNKIIGILPQQENNQEQAGVEFYNGIICPGFINAHCHLELSHLKAQIPKHSKLPEFISQVVSKRNLFENIQESMQIANDTMYKNGIVAVGDISNVDDSFLIKENSKIIYHTFIELFDFFKPQSQVFNQGKELFRSYFEKQKVSLSPHAPYSCSRQLISRISEHAREYRYPVTIHNQEYASENELYQSKSGELFDFFVAKGMDFSNFNAFKKSSLEAIAPHLPENQHILFVHNMCTNQHDISFLKTLRTTDTYTFVVCALSNQYIANELPPFDLFLQNSLSVALGTDSLASNTELSIVSEMYCLQNAFPKVTLQQLLQCATRNGAIALGLQKKFGSFSQNKSPGVILLENVDLQNLKLQEHTKVRVLV
jgi:cytosine/adenosine deaminase-related metal-dependent hydrolase